MRFIHVSDIHVIPRGNTLNGVDPIDNLQKCVVDINRFAAGGAGAPPAQFCVFSGDLVDRGDRESYQLLREILDDLSLPYYLISAITIGASRFATCLSNSRRTPLASSNTPSTRRQVPWSSSIPSKTI